MLQSVLPWAESILVRPTTALRCGMSCGERPEAVLRPVGTVSNGDQAAGGSRRRQRGLELHGHKRRAAERDAWLQGSAVAPAQPPASSPFETVATGLSDASGRTPQLMPARGQAGPHEHLIATHHHRRSHRRAQRFSRCSSSLHVSLFRWFSTAVLKTTFESMVVADAPAPMQF